MTLNTWSRPMVCASMAMPSMLGPKSSGGGPLVPQDRVFRLLVESVRDYAIFVLDPSGRISSWNIGAERLKGYTTDEIIGQHFSRFYPAEAVRAGKCDELLASAARDGRVEDEGWRVRKDGSRFWADVVITALRDDSGALVGFAKVTRDLTERLRAEEERIRRAQAEEARRVEQEARAAVEEARASLAVTIRSIGDAVIATDTAGNVTMMNPVAERLTGWSFADAAGRPVRGVFHIINEDTRRLVESPVDRVLREGIVVGLANHTVLIARDGTETVITDSGAPIRDDAGHVRGVVLVFRDASIEARENARRAFLAEATTALSASLDVRETFSRIATVLVPRFADWCIVEAFTEDGSQPACVGAAHADPLKSNLVRELGRRFQATRGGARGLMKVMQTGRPERFPLVTEAEIAELMEDDHQARLARELRMTSALMVPLTAVGRVLGAIMVVFADSGRRYDDGDVAFIEELATRASVAVENARLYAAEQRARELADSASRMKDDFLATVSHELRTPLSAILGWSRMLSTSRLTEERRSHAVETIERNARSMAQLIEDLLDVSRIVSGKMRIDFVRVDLAAVVFAAMESVRPAAEAKEIRLEQSLADDVGIVYGDAVRLQQVVWNLLSNAVKFTSRGGSVRLYLRREHDDAAIVVVDTGIGIEPKFIQHVFEPFRQADASMKRTVGGLGLGLAIVKYIVEQHGGRVEVESEGQNRGSRFTVRLPLVAGDVRAARTGAGAERTVHEQAPKMPKLDGLHVLVVEDDADTREMLREVLASCGARVSVAASVPEAMRMFAADVPDVLVSDVGMPGETGFDLIRKVRQLPPEAGGQIPAAALTAYARGEDRRAMLAAGFELHIAKPVDPSELCAMVSMLSRFRKM